MIFLCLVLCFVWVFFLLLLILLSVFFRRRSERALTEETLSPAVESSARRMAQHLIRHTLSKCQDHVDKVWYKRTD